MSLWKWLKKKLHPTVKAITTLGGLINYQQNDPSTPDLDIVKNIPTLPKPCPPFSVLHFTGKDGVKGSIEDQAANVYCTIAFSLGFIQTKIDKPIIKWAAMNKLIANPRSGKMFNAYYDRYYLNFFYDNDPKTNQVIYTCDSTDVVAHELGHAILDSLRPDLWSVQSVEIQAFHEAFGDINAIMTALVFTEMIDKALLETNNDLSKENTISKLAEQMGVAIGNASGTEMKSLRNAVNSLYYVAPETLPPSAPGEALAGEPHNFSRVFVGAWYDAFVNIYNNEKLKVTPQQAAINARDKIAKITYNAIRFANKTAKFFNSVLDAMLVYDASHNMGCGQAIRDGFAKHGITTAQKLNMNMTEQDNQPIHAELNISFDSLSMVERVERCVVELANHPAAGFIKGKNEIEDALHAAHHALKILHLHGRIGHGPSAGKFHNKEFSLIDGKMVRNFYCCHFHKK